MGSKMKREKLIKTTRSKKQLIETAESEDETGCNAKGSSMNAPPGDKLECQTCGYITDKKINLKYHSESVHLGLRPHKCTSCEYAALYKRHLDRHMKTKHPDLEVCEISDNLPDSKRFKCSLCDYTTNKSHDLNRHINSVHSKSKKYECDKCDYASDFLKDVKKHKSCVHLNSNQLHCPLCDHVATLHSNLKTHIDSVHLDPPKFKCFSCEYTAPRKCDLEVHIVSAHLKLKPHECHICGYASSRQIYLKKHIDSIHLDIKKYKCESCDYSTNIKQHLQRHVKSIHSETIQPDDSEKSAEQKKNVETQQLNSSHNKAGKPKKHQCELCEYESIKKADVKKHVDRVHSDSKKHKNC